MIRKRQLMRSSFGDYRAKMAEEEKKLRLGLLPIKIFCFSKIKINLKYFRRQTADSVFRSTEYEIVFRETIGSVDNR